MSQVIPPGQKKQTFLRKFFDKFKQDPFVPIGCMVTGVVLGGGLLSMRDGNAAKSQKFMRVRVIAQGLTVGVMCIGGIMMGSSPLAAPTPKPTMEDKLLEARVNRGPSK